MAQIEKVHVIQRRLITDDRGWFLKVITGTEEGIPSHTGEVYLTMGEPGQAKGGHYHPEAVEWFTIIVVVLFSNWRTWRPTSAKTLRCRSKRQLLSSSPTMWLMWW